MEAGGVRRDLVHGAMREVLSRETADSIDSCVTDPPYALTADTGQTFPGRYDVNPSCSKGGFMGLAWDSELPTLEDWREVFRVLKPGAHLLAFGGTRTVHRLATLIEAAGFEIRDMLEWVYLSGFPKSLDVSKAIDKSAGHWRGKAGSVSSDNGSMSGPNYERTDKGDPVTAAAAAAGWGTALKPAHEPIVLARKPMLGTVCATWAAHSTGAMNIDGCRIPYASEEDKAAAAAAAAAAQRLNHDRPGEVYKLNGVGKSGFTHPRESIEPYLASMGAGRWPANVIAEPGTFAPDAQKVFDLDAWARGVASGLFACPKPTASEKEAGLKEAGSTKEYGIDRLNAPAGRRNLHPTVKPVTLMRWLVRLVTPPGGVVLEPFAGSGTTAIAAIEEGCGYLAIEREAEYVEIAKARIASAQRQGSLF